MVTRTEAMHGDLGMIEPKDIAILISNKGAAVAVQIQHGAPVAAQDGSGAGLPDLTAQGGADGICLGFGGDDAEEMIPREEGGDRQGDGGLGDVLQPGEAPVVDLLVAADGIQLHGLDRLGVGKNRHGGIVESDVAVFSDAHDHDIGGVLAEQGGVAVALGLGILCGDVDVEHLLEVGQPEDMLLQEVAEALGRVGGEADVLVHVEGVDAVPRDLFVGGQAPQHLVLGGGGGEDHVDGLLMLQQGQDAGLDIPRGGGAHLGAGVVDLYRQKVFFI